MYSLRSPASSARVASWSSRPPGVGGGGSGWLVVFGLSREEWEPGGGRPAGSPGGSTLPVRVWEWGR
jgi:hypothetical protein